MKRKIIKWAISVLNVFSRWTIRRYRPGIVGITGSVGKTSAKDAITLVLGSARRIRATHGNFNSEIGFSLAILGEWKDDDVAPFSLGAPRSANRLWKFIFLARVVAESSFRLLFRRRSQYPELIVLEYGADKPGDIERLVHIASPNIAVITAIGDVPAHVETYSGPEAVVREKTKLITKLPPNGFAVLNADDDTVLNLKNRTRASVLTFGFGESADVRILNFEHRINQGEPIGVSFKLRHAGSTVPVKIDNCFGNATAYAAAAAAAVGLAFGINLVRITETLSLYVAPEHRMRLIHGVKHTNILDDTYNASPLSMSAAIKTAAALPGLRKVAVFGDMLEIGRYAVEAHEAIGEQIGKTFDLLVTIGPRARFIASSAVERGFPRENAFSFDDAKEAGRALQDLIKKGDLILIKASRAMALERIVEEVREVPVPPSHPA